MRNTQIESFNDSHVTNRIREIELNASGPV